MNYVRIKLSTGKVDGEPGGLPMPLLGLADASLADLSAALDPVPAAFKGFGFWPVDGEPASFDPQSQALTGAAELAVDVPAKRVRSVPQVRDLTAEEIESARPMALIIGKGTFLDLLQSAGGLTDEKLLTARKDPRLEALWVKLELYSEVKIDHPSTQAGIQALVGLGYMSQEGAAAALAAWPRR